MSVLIVAEHLRGQVRPITLELVSAAKELGEETAVAVIAKDPAALADQVDVEGVKEIVSVKVEQDEFENDVYREAVEQLISDRSPDVVLVGFTVNGMGYAPALAAKLGIGFASRRLRAPARRGRPRRRAILLRVEGERRDRLPRRTTASS